MDWHLDSLLNLPNVTVATCTQEAEQVFLELALLNEAAPCPHCQTCSDKIHQNRPVFVRDLAIFGRPVYLHVPRRQFYCRQCQRYFTESLEFVDWERRYTQRYEEYIYQRVQASNIEQVRREEGLSWDQVNGIFDYKFNLKKNENWGEVKRLCIDEISKRKGHDNFVTVVGDIAGGELLEVIDSHKQEEIIEALKQQPVAVREQVQEVSVDMWGGFPKVVQEIFTNARLVFDRFHVMKYVNKDLNKVRKQVEGNDKKKSKKAKTIKGSKFILLKNNVDLKDHEREQLEQILSQSKRLRLAYELKEEFRSIYETNQTPEMAKQQILAWLEKASSVYCESLTTIREHIDGICNYFISRTTSGMMEGMNNKLKLIKRQAYGFVNFDNFRTRLLACCSH